MSRQVGHHVLQLHRFHRDTIARGDKGVARGLLRVAPVGDVIQRKLRHHWARQYAGRGGTHIERMTQAIRLRHIVDKALKQPGHVGAQVIEHYHQATAGKQQRGLELVARFLGIVVNRIGRLPAGAAVAGDRQHDPRIALFFIRT